jgi:predicted nucleotidyltransferase
LKRDTITAAQIKINPALPETTYSYVSPHLNRGFSSRIASMAATRELAIPIPHEAIAAFCRKWGVRRLSFFGSVVRDDFDPERSDVDVLVELRPDTKARGLAFFGAEIELTEIFGGRKVEMMTGVREAYRQSIESDLVVEYVEEI